jgi:hypothetical protein
MVGVLVARVNVDVRNSGQDDRIDRMRPPGHPVHPVTPVEPFGVRCSVFGIAFGLVRPGWLE